MKISAVVFLMFFVVTGEVSGQTTFLGGANVNINDHKPLTNIRYFGGIEFKIWIAHNLKVYLSPQYSGLTENDYRMESAILPLGMSYEFNELWDDKTILFRFVDINLGPYGGYIFDVKHNQDFVKDGYTAIDYGVQLSVKLRLFIFYPLYLSYNHSLAYLIESGSEKTFKYATLQFGVYFPISYFLKNY
jgi:hypothetical protein